ncbi:MAG: hypothetical protein KDI18_04325 [Gammaproteobacteria bacterium]|nr:hypothetical protein [Gammaproteobacteria bacterium]
MKSGVTKKPIGSIFALLFALAVPVPGWSAGNPVLVAMGDSIGEGVQGADAAWQTQFFSYVNLVGLLLQQQVSVPFIQSGLFGVVGNTEGRSRIYPNAVTTNVAVSGATVNSLLYDQADAAVTGAINSETDLVLFPRQQTQIGYVETAIPAVVLCWIGNNDVLSTATAFGNLDGSQLTPLADFDRDYRALAARLSPLVTNNGTKVVFANLPDVTAIGLLANRATAEAILGFPVDLPDGSYTSIITVLLMGLFGNDDLLQFPNFVLDSSEVALIRSRTQEFNAIIQREADALGMPVVDINAKFNELLANPPIFLGIPVTNRLLGGLFSLDGVHPSNIGHALIANEFVTTMNQAFGMTLPVFDQAALEFLFSTDPSIDKDGDGKAVGRLGVGLIETLAFILGITGDSNDFLAN